MRINNNIRTGVKYMKGLLFKRLYFKSFLTGPQDLKVNLFGLQQDKHSDGNGKNNDVGIAR